MKTIEVPTLSQSNDIHDEYRSNPNSTEPDDVRLHPGTGMSDGWCGRASAAMIYNYLTQVDAYIRGATALSGKTQADRLEATYQQTKQVDHGSKISLLLSKLAILIFSTLVLVFSQGCTSGERQSPSESDQDIQASANRVKSVSPTGDKKAQITDPIKVEVQHRDDSRTFLVVADTLGVRIDTLISSGEWSVQNAQTRRDGSSGTMLVYECLAYAGKQKDWQPCLTMESIGGIGNLQDAPDIRIAFNYNVSIRDRYIKIYMNPYETNYIEGKSVYNFLEFYSFPEDGIIALSSLE